MLSYLKYGNTSVYTNKLSTKTIATFRMVPKADPLSCLDEIFGAEGLGA